MDGNGFRAMLTIETNTWPIHDPCGDKAFSTSLDTHTSLILLADGMDGYDDAHRAAEVAIQETCNYLHLHRTGAPAQDIVEAFHAADRAMGVLARQCHQKVGAALALLLIDEERVYFASLGDIHLYRVSPEGHITLLNQAHRIESAGQSYLTQCLHGRGLRYSPEVQTWAYTPSESFLLCTDGAHTSYPSSTFLDRSWEQLPMDKHQDDCSYICISFTATV